MIIKKYVLIPAKKPSVSLSVRSKAPVFPEPRFFISLTDSTELNRIASEASSMVLIRVTIFLYRSGNGKSMVAGKF